MANAGARTERLARVAFAALVLATFSAFFVTQRLKHEATVVQGVEMDPYFSPLGSFHPVEHISFRIKRSDEVTVTIVAPSGDDIATLVRGRSATAYKRLHLSWAGRLAGGQVAPDATYRVRVRLRDQARSLLLVRSFLLHTAPPQPSVNVAGASALSAAILPAPGGAPAAISISLAGGRDTQLWVYRTDVSPAVLVRTLPLAAGATTSSWDGRDAAGNLMPDGSYLVAVRVIDHEGNAGSAPALLPPVAGEYVPGHAGITVRRLGVEPPYLPVPVGWKIQLGVDARRAPYVWSVTRVGTSRPQLHGKGHGPLLRFRAPFGNSGAYVLAVRSGGTTVRAPFAVQAAATQHVLVVLPAITWLGRDTGDDNGSGEPDTLDSGQRVRTARVLAGGLPTGFAARVAPVLAFLDHRRLHYDITTDLGLAQHSGPHLHGHTGVLLVGDERWLPATVTEALRAFVRGGGRIVSLGIDSLRRPVALSATELGPAIGPEPTDIFGAHLAPLASTPGPITGYLDQIGLFKGGAGLFSGYTTYEATQSVGTRARLVASAVTADGRPVIAAVRYGRGLVIRTGLPELPARLHGDASATALLARIWELLSQ